MQALSTSARYEPSWNLVARRMFWRRRWASCLRSPTFSPWCLPPLHPMAWQPSEPSPTLTCRWSGLKLYDCLVSLINLSLVLTKSPVYRLRQMRVRHELLVLGGGYNSNDTLLSELENAWENIRPQKVEAPWQQNPVVFSSTRSSNLS